MKFVLNLFKNIRVSLEFEQEVGNPFPNHTPLHDLTNTHIIHKSILHVIVMTCLRLPLFADLLVLFFDVKLAQDVLLIGSKGLEMLLFDELNYVSSEPLDFDLDGVEKAHLVDLKVV